MKNENNEQNHINNALLVKALDLIVKQLKEIDDSLMTIVSRIDAIYFEENEDE